jgi:hypothetical protein
MMTDHLRVFYQDKKTKGCGFMVFSLATFNDRPASDEVVVEAWFDKREPDSTYIAHEWDQD